MQRCGQPKSQGLPTAWRESEGQLSIVGRAAKVKAAGSETPRGERAKTSEQARAHNHRVVRE
jgi:hypothetical protein